MPISEHKTRVAITVDDVLLAKMDSYLEKTRQTRSQFITGLVGRELANQDAVMEGVMSALNTLVDRLAHDSDLANAEDIGRALYGEDWGKRPAGL